MQSVIILIYLNMQWSGRKFQTEIVYFFETDVIFSNIYILHFFIRTSKFFVEAGCS